MLHASTVQCRHRAPDASDFHGATLHRTKFLVSSTPCFLASDKSRRGMMTATGKSCTLRQRGEDRAATLMHPMTEHCIPKMQLYPPVHLHQTISQYRGIRVPISWWDSPLSPRSLTSSGRGDNIVLSSCQFASSSPFLHPPYHP